MWFTIGVALIVIGVIIAYVLAHAYEHASHAPDGPKVIMILLLLVGAVMVLGSTFTKLWTVMP